MPSNSKRGGVEFEADGKTWTLRLTTNAQVRFQDAEGKTLLEALQAMQAGVVDMKTLRAMFQHSLTPTLDAEAAGDLMDEVGIIEAAAMIGRAAQAAFPAAEDQSKSDPRKAPSVISSARG